MFSLIYSPHVILCFGTCFTWMLPLRTCHMTCALRRRFLDSKHFQIQSQLKPWVQSWCDHRAAGGVAGTSVQHALMHIRKAIADEASCFVKLDIASFFDSIQLPILQRALQHLRFPPSVMSVLLDFYAGAERVFTLAGAHTPEWAAIDCGLAQGCPLSPVLASALSHLWASYVASDGHPCRVGALAYIDDRTLWLRKGCPVSCMRDALLRSCPCRGFRLQAS